MRNLATAWNDFWFAQGSSQSLALVRIFYGITVLMKCTGLWGLERMNRWAIDLPRRRTPPISELGDLYRDPVPGFEWIPAMPAAAWDACETIALVAALLWTVGLLTRTAGITLWLYFLVPMLHSRFDYWHHNWNFAMFLGLLAFAPMADHYSLDRSLFRRRSPAPKRSMHWLRLVQVLLTWIYISTLLGKLNSGWFDGTVMSIMDETGMLKGPFKPLVLAVFDARALSLYTLFAQFIFAALIWTRYRRWAWLFGAGLHLGIDMLMNVTTFSYQMLALYICFVEPRSQDSRVHYDGSSPRQQVLARLGRLLDWFDRFEWRDIRDGSTPHPDGLLFEAADGQRLAGLRALREIALRLPVTFLPAFALEPLTWRRGHG